MAIQLQAYLSPHFKIHQSVPFRKPIYGMVMPRKVMLPLSKTIKLQIKSSIRDMVFEDQSRGIVCYKDDRGEIICEGLDEGPRLLPLYQPTPLPSSRDDGGERLEERWLRFVDGESGANSSVLVKEQHSCNGYNTLY